MPLAAVDSQVEDLVENLVTVFREAKDGLEDEHVRVAL